MTSEHWEIFSWPCALPECGTVVLFWGDEKPEELDEGLQRPVGGIEWLICIPEILVLSGRNQLIISFRPRFLMGRMGLVQI